jgi:hypothetical protein|tara:strand:+ start:213 stop:740 length:528 start_codon:yes stop_codon:yes gene_type:complete
MFNREKLTKKDWLAKAEEFKQSAIDSRTKEQSSWERSDTDGFLSQACLSASSSLDDAKASICENFGKDAFLGLYQSGRRVKAKYIWVKDQYSYGDKALWLLHEDERELFGGKKFLPSNYGNGRSRILNSFNLEERYEDDDAWACFSKGWSSTPTIFRVGDEWGATATLIKENDND